MVQMPPESNYACALAQVWLVSRTYGIRSLSNTGLQLFGAGFQIHDGAGVLVLGDSITDELFYVAYIEACALPRRPN